MPSLRHFWQKMIVVPVAVGLTGSVLAATPVNGSSVFANTTDGTTIAENSNNKNQKPVANNPTGAATAVKPSTMTALNPVAPVLNANGYYLQDVYSGNTLASQNPDKRMQPASLTKLMTLYLTFEALQAGRIHINDLVPISVNAWKTGGSRMFLKVGDQISVSDLIDGIIIDSGNDACVALAEDIGGTESSFVNLMNEQAQLLGMKNTHYMDCTGLPDPQHYTTPRDMAILTRALIVNFPQYYPLFAQKTFTFNNITQPNRNRLLWRDPTVDGLKTGHTDEAGFCLIASAQRNGMRVVSVLLGAPTDEMRAEYSEELLNYAFRFYETHKVYSANRVIEQVPVYMGKSHVVPIGVTNDFYITVPNGQFSNVNMNLQVKTPLNAPLKQGQKVGTVTATINDKEIANVDLVALTQVKEGNIFSRMIDRVKLSISKI